MKIVKINTVFYKIPGKILKNTYLGQPKLKSFQKLNPLNRH